MQLLPPKSSWLAGFRHVKLLTENRWFAFMVYWTGATFFFLLLFFQTSLESRLVRRHVVQAPECTAHFDRLSLFFRPATAHNLALCLRILSEKLRIRACFKKSKNSTSTISRGPAEKPSMKLLFGFRCQVLPFLTRHAIVYYTAKFAFWSAEVIY